MSWKNLAAPLMVIATGVTIIILVLSAPDRRSNTGAGARGVAAQEEEPCSAYPANGKPIPGRCLTPEPTDASAYPGHTTETTTTTTPGTATATVTTTTTTTTSTITPEATSPAVSIAPPTARTASIVPAPEDTSTPETNGPAATTPEATPASALTCAPGERVLITGQGPPRAAFLLYFGQRVVGGGSVSLTGSFSIPLVVGHERPGSYPVVVRVRGSEQVLRELTCEVPPAVSPTPAKNV